jgi:dipeptidyl aminopeptidase/acylaminoacyl peptidase
MPTTCTTRLALLTLAVALVPAGVQAQGTLEDYRRADALRDEYEALAINLPGPATWIGETGRFWYRLAVKGGARFVVFDVTTGAKTPAFDHERLAATLSKVSGGEYSALKLPFSTFTFTDGERGIEMTVQGAVWRCTLQDYTCEREEERGGPGGRREEDDRPRRSPDGKWEALVDNFNVAVREAGGKTLVHLSQDGSEGDPYVLSSFAWSPDSTKLAACRVKPGYEREVHYVESSPEDQVQPKYSSRRYLKPGDVLDVEQPVLFDVTTRTQMTVDRTLFPNAYDISRLVWRKDGRAFTFEYNQRGHQVYRVIEVDGVSGRARAVISEEPKTFFNYRTANGRQTDSGKRYRYDVDDGREVIWMSERDGWNHLYLYDGATGRVKNQITKGEWAVRAVLRVDEASRQIYFTAGGMYPGKDPYFVHAYRIGFDGSGLIALTTADANHDVSLSSDGTCFVDTYSRADVAPVSELRRTDDRSLVAEVERGDISALRQIGWKPPGVFVAKGRDGVTDIWGVIFRPTTFDAAKRYPVIENIYAGPQGSFVPKSFAAYTGMRSLAELGFIVVQIDGMGTSNRSKAFQDVAWQNLGDAGLPDRILWHQAVAAKYPWYDVSRVGIYGTSAGGQSSLGALLFHPDFYKVAVSASGCHDNRMDKIWWNEQWMGWPIGPQYSASSNVDNAYRLQGDLLLIVGEMDTNVDPSSTLQVVNQLIKHDKAFDLLFIPGAGHTSGGDYGEHKRRDFFVQHLLGVTPPPWSAFEKKASEER